MNITTFTAELGLFWIKYFPNLRFGQLMTIFEDWVEENTSYNDLFYIEDDRFLELFKEFAEAVGYKG